MIKTLLRRQFLTGLVSGIVVAPSIVQAANLMPIKSSLLPAPTDRRFRYMVLTPSTRRLGTVAWDCGDHFELPPGQALNFGHGKPENPLYINDYMMPFPITFCGAGNTQPRPVHTDIGVFSLEHQRPPQGLLLPIRDRPMPEQLEGVTWSWTTHRRGFTTAEVDASAIRAR